MLLELLKDGFTRDDLVSVLLFIPIVLISLTVHEYCHGYVAYKCGDNTAQWNGRLTLNPLKHLDPIGTIMMLFFGFGYARPVPINPRNFKHYRRDLCFVSIAGPLSNLLLALIGVIALYISMEISPEYIANIAADGFSYYQDVPNFKLVWIRFAIYFISSNISLAVFNLLPIPPLDGSRIIASFLPAKIAYYYNKYESFIMIAVFALLYFNILDGVIFFLRNILLSGIVFLVELVPFFDTASQLINL